MAVSQHRRRRAIFILLSMHVSLALLAGAYAWVYYLYSTMPCVFDEASRANLSIMQAFPSIYWIPYLALGIIVLYWIKGHRSIMKNERLWYPLDQKDRYAVRGEPITH